MPRYFGSPAATGGGSVALPVLTSAPHGGNNPWTVADAITASGKTFFSVINGSSGNLEAYEYVESGGTIAGPTVLRTNLVKDAHCSAALAVRSDGRLVAAYSQHNTAGLWLRISTNAYDSTSWGTETNLNTTLNSGNYTDPSLHWIGTDLYLVYRQETTPGTGSKWKIAKSTDGGVTWSGISVFYFEGSSVRCYLTARSDGINIHFIATNSTTAGTHKIVHFYTNGTNAYKSDGTLIGTLAGGNPGTDANCTTVYSGSSLAFPLNVAIDSGKATFTYELLNGSTWEYWYGRWSGSAWATTALATGLTGFGYNPSTSNDSSYECTPDDGDVNTVWAIELVSSQPELVKYVTANGGSSFTRTQVTSGSSHFMAVPVPVRDPTTPGLRAVWWDAGASGSWTDYQTYSLGMKGIHVT